MINFLKKYGYRTGMLTYFLYDTYRDSRDTLLDYRKYKKGDKNINRYNITKYEETDNEYNIAIYGSFHYFIPRIFFSFIWPIATLSEVISNIVLMNNKEE